MALVNIWDVGHGVFVSLIADDGQLWLFDCGHGDTMRPSHVLPGNTIDRLVVSNFDHDHISDLEDLARKFHIKVLTRNPSITAQQLRALKLQSGPIGGAMETLLSLMDGRTTGGIVLPVPEPKAEGVRVSMFWNRYGLPFTDTNNISLVTFLHVHGMHMVLPGDLEKAGWELLLRDPAFCSELATVNVFMASHHGRENGYCAEVFDYCRPELVVISDCEKKHSTQEMTATYIQHATGCRMNDGRTRFVLTTRFDGMISFKATPFGTMLGLGMAVPAAPRVPSLGAWY